MKTPIWQNLFFIAFMLTAVIISPETAIAQNKSLGVGTAIPNSNAALHVESPTSNQGFIMPRLTTVQRTAMTATLTVTDKGLMLYDTDLNDVFIWDGTAWGNSGDFSLPATKILSNADLLNDPVALDIRYAGDSVRTLLNIDFQTSTNELISNPVRITHRGQGAALNLTQTSVLGTGALFTLTNPLNPQGAVRGVTAGVGPAIHGVQNGLHGNAGLFRSSNADNDSSALYVEANGIRTAARFVQANPSAQGAGVDARSVGIGPTIFALNLGTGNGVESIVGGTAVSYGHAGVFNTFNPNNSAPSIFSMTQGTGPVQHLVLNNPASTSHTIDVSSDGQGSVINAHHNGMLGIVGDFRSNNINNTSQAVRAFTNAGWTALEARREGATNGNAIFAEVVDPANSYAALQVVTNGTGAATNIRQQNPANTAPALFVDNEGTGAGITSRTNAGWTAVEGVAEGNGHAGFFNIENASSTNTTLQVNQAGLGSAAYFEVSNATGTAPAIGVQSNSPGGAVKGTAIGSGYAGWFEVSNPASSSNALWTSHNGVGTAFLANHTGSGGNIAVFQNNNGNVARIDKTGQGFFNGGTVNSGADLAEMFDVEGERNSYEPGDVLVISEDTDRTVEQSNEPNSKRVAGVYATKPGVLLTEKGVDENLSELVPMGVVGVIPTKVCLENGPIKRGDLLVTASKKGHAMKAIPAIINGVEIYPTGAILGKALENFDASSTGSGLIKVLVNVK